MSKHTIRLPVLESMRPVISTIVVGLCSIVFCDPRLLAADSNRQVETIELARFREMVNSVNAGDAARYARLYSNSATITILGGSRLEGLTAIERYEAELLRQFPGTRLAFYEIWLKGPLAVVHYGVSGHTSSGQPMGHEGLLFFQFASRAWLQPNAATTTA